MRGSLGQGAPLVSLKQSIPRTVASRPGLHPLFLAPTTLMDAPPLDLIKAARDAGYDGLGLRLHPSPKLPYHPVVGDAPLIRQMKHALSEAKLAVLDIYTFYLEPTTRLDDFTPALALGAELGAGYALVQGADPIWSRLLDNFSGFCERARRFGLTASLEFVPQRDLATLAQARRLITDSGRPDAAICVDPLHLARGGGAPDDLRNLDLRLLPYLQFSDGVLAEGEPDLNLAKRIGVGERRLPGQGILPLADLLEVVPDDLPLSVEVARPAGASMADAVWARTVIEETRRFIRSHHGIEAE
jgi:sugar phosphate isomerase/epimerase